MPDIDTFNAEEFSKEFDPDIKDTTDLGQLDAKFEDLRCKLASEEEHARILRTAKRRSSVDLRLEAFRLAAQLHCSPVVCAGGVGQPLSDVIATAKRIYEWLRD